MSLENLVRNLRTEVNNMNLNVVKMEDSVNDALTALKQDPTEVRDYLSTAMQRNKDMANSCKLMREKLQEMLEELANIPKLQAAQAAQAAQAPQAAQAALAARDAKPVSDNEQLDKQRQHQKRPIEVSSDDEPSPPPTNASNTRGKKPRRTEDEHSEQQGHQKSTFFVFLAALKKDPKHWEIMEPHKGSQPVLSKYGSYYWSTLSPDVKRAFTSENAQSEKLPSLPEVVPLVYNPEKTRWVKKPTRKQIPDETEDEEEDDMPNEYFTSDGYLQKKKVLDAFQDTWTWFDAKQISSEALWFMEQLDGRWDSENELRTRVISDILKIQVQNMDQLVQEFRDKLRLFLGLPCHTEENGWNETVIQTFKNWKNKFDFINLSMFKNGSPLHKLSTKNFQDVKTKVDSFLNRNKDNIQAQTFGNKLLNECNRCQDPFLGDGDYLADEEMDEYFNI